MAEELIGFTIQDSIPNEIKEPVTTLEKAKEYQNKDIWKIDWKTGRFKLRRTKSGVTRLTSLWATPKQKEPHEWFDFEGVVPPRKEKAGVPGSTKNYPGVFLRIDEGKIEYGFSKGYYLEVFLSEGKLKGKHIFRALGTEELQSRIEPVAKIEVLPPSEETESPSPVRWLFIQPVDQTPYVLSEGVERGILPPYGFSALPSEIRKLIPEELQYWNERDRTKALEMRRQILSLDIISKESGKFTLHRRYWLDEKHKTIRYGPSEEVYDLTIKYGDKLIHYSLVSDPLDRLGFTAYKTNTDERILEIKEEEVKPMTLLNPTKATPCRIELIDNGSCIIYQDSPEFLKVKFKGKKLEGLFIGKKEPNTNFWEFETASSPVNKVIPITKIDSFQGIICGPVLIPNRVDRQGHIISKEEIEKAMYDFMRYARNISFMHQDQFINDEVFILECALQKGDYRLEDGRVIPDGTWYLTIQETNPERLELIRSGKIRGFSIRGLGRLKKIQYV